jgi:hypothetical protein
VAHTAVDSRHTDDPREKKVIFASSSAPCSSGTTSTCTARSAAIIGKQFFSNLDPASQVIFSLLAFAAGLHRAAVRRDLLRPPRRHDRTQVHLPGDDPDHGPVDLRRRPAAQATASIGIAAPIILIGLRLLQGLALGGEYGGAATYVAEHSPHGKRGEFTSWIQTTATLGLFLSLLVILGVRTWTGEEAFAEWGWRIPFLVSFILLGDQRLDPALDERVAGLQEDEGRGQDLEGAADRVVRRVENLKIVILALLGLTMGQAVVWYTGQFYALFFLTGALEGRRRDREHPDRVRAADRHAVLHRVRQALRQDRPQADHHGRLPAGRADLLPAVPCADRAANPELAAAQAKNKVVVVADPARCSFQFNPTGVAKFTSSCDVAKQALAGRSVSYENEAAPPAASPRSSSTTRSFPASRRRAWHRPRSRPRTTRSRRRSPRR